MSEDFQQLGLFGDVVRAPKPKPAPSPVEPRKKLGPPAGLDRDAVFCNPRGRVVGRVANDGYVEKRGIEFETHHMHSWHGWATELEHIPLMEQAHARGIRLILNDGRVFESELEDWVQHAETFEGVPTVQAVLSDRYWRRSA